jgi:outer membrane protease
MRGKVKYCWLLGLLLLGPAVGAQDVGWSGAPWKAVFPYTFSAAPALGALLGRAEEIVYQDAGGDAKLSHILWDILPVVYAGFSLDCSPIDPWRRWGFFGEVKVKWGLPLMKTGIMEDRDWQDPADPSVMTDYSKHDAHTKGVFLLDAAFGLSAPIRLPPLIPAVSALRVKGFIGFSLMYHSWSAENGYGEYQNLGNYAFYGPVISYQQVWYILTPGIAVEIPFLSRFSAELGFQISPLVWCVAQDHHLTRHDFGHQEQHLFFQDVMDYGLFLEPQARFAFTPLPRLSLALSGAWRFIQGVRGDTSITYTGLYRSSSPAEPRIDYNTGGAGYSVFEIGLSAALRF